MTTTTSKTTPRAQTATCRIVTSMVLLLATLGATTAWAPSSSSLLTLRSRTMTMPWTSLQPPPRSIFGLSALYSTKERSSSRSSKTTNGEDDDLSVIDHPTVLEGEDATSFGRTFKLTWVDEDEDFGYDNDDDDEDDTTTSTTTTVDESDDWSDLSYDLPSGDGTDESAAALTQAPPEGPIYIAWETGVAETIRAMVAENAKGSANNVVTVGVAGVSGSGKAMSSGVLQHMLDDLGCRLLPLDIYLSQQNPNDKDTDDGTPTKSRRPGSPGAIDSAALRNDLERLRQGGPDEASVVLVEGLYLLHDENNDDDDDDDWTCVRDLLDYTVYVDADVEACLDRLVERRDAIVQASEEVDGSSALNDRMDESELRMADRINAEIVQRSKEYADLVVMTRYTPDEVIAVEEEEDSNEDQGIGGVASMADDVNDDESIGMLAVDSAVQVLNRQLAWQAEAPEDESASAGEVAGANSGDSTDDDDEDAPAQPSGIVTITWESGVAETIRQRVTERPISETEPFMVGVVGNPGSGKSTSCGVLQAMLDDLGCLLMPIDGYHYSKQDLLDLFEDPADALYRRGAPDTFDAAAVTRDLLRIKSGEEEKVSVPGFSHAVADPEPNAHTFKRSDHAIVLCEGLYLLHDDDDDNVISEASWRNVKATFDLTLFINASVEDCVARVKDRNKCIPGYTPEELEARCEAVDRVNAMTVQRSKQHADIVVESGYKPQEIITDLSAPEDAVECDL